MKILSLVWFKVLPTRFGGQKGTARFNYYLGKQSALTCLAAADNAPDEPLPYQLRPELPVGKKQVVLPKARRVIARVVREERPTHLLLEYPYFARSAAAACKSVGARLILHAHNIEYRRFRDLGKWWWRLLRPYEKWAMRKADLVLFKTGSDADTAVREFGIDRDKCMIIPYGIEPQQAALPDRASARRDLGIDNDIPVLLFAGTLDYAPNADAVSAIYEHLAPELDKIFTDYRVLICGRNQLPGFGSLKELQHPRIHQLGEVASLAPYYAAADVFINPVRTGGGVQTKVIDALAAQLSVVSFSFALEGIEQEIAGTKLWPVGAGDWRGFAAAAREARNSPAPTPEAFFQHYSWPQITARLIDRLKKL